MKARIFRRSFSEKVLARKADRRSRVTSRTLHAIATASMIVFAGWFIHQSKVDSEKINAPSWADFSMVGTSPGKTERVSTTTPSGVPNSITINGESWSIVEVNHFGDTDDTHTGRHTGTTYCQNKTIAYIRDDNDSRLKVTIMHEVFHAGACLHGGDTWWNSENPTEDEHIGIYHLGQFTSVFLQENPLFVNFMVRP